MEIQNYSQFCWHSLTGVEKSTFTFGFSTTLYLATLKLKLLATTYVHNVPLGFSRLWVFCFGEFRKKYFVENNISIARAAVKLPRLFLYLILIHIIFQQGPHYETLTNAE